MTLRTTVMLALVVGCGGEGCGGGKDADSSTTPAGGGTSADCAELAGDALPAALYSAWGSSAWDIWAVGADDGTGPLVLHYGGEDWERVQTGTTGDLWWVWGNGTDSRWFSGEGGRVIHHQPSANSFDEMQAADPDIVLFGLWGTGDDNVYAVGSATDGSGQGTVVHYDGIDWTAETVPAEAGSGQVFKIWGSGANDIWAVGSSCADHEQHRGRHLGHGSRPRPSTTASRRCSPIDGCGSTLVAVGGFGNAAVARSDDGGATWYNDSPEPLAARTRASTACPFSCDGDHHRGRQQRRACETSTTMQAGLRCANCPCHHLRLSRSRWVDSDGWNLGRRRQPERADQRGDRGFECHRSVPSVP